MCTRKAVSTVTQRKLWMESMGHCMNPSCEVSLIVDGAYIGEFAHIVPHKEEGSVEFENLIGLCRNCHNKIDSKRNNRTIRILQTWKTTREEEIAARFTQKFSSFKLLQEYVVPLLRRNRAIYECYGPGTSGSSDDGHHTLWIAFEAEILVNNRKILLAMERNRKLLHRENQDIILDFRVHIEEFVHTRMNKVRRVQLFPQELSSIFGEEKIRMDPAPNVSALENLIKLLVEKDRFYDLELEPEQVVTYWKNGKLVTLDLCNRPWIQQLYWTKRLYSPRTTDLPLRTLVFFLEWLTNHGITYRFPDVKRLTRIMVGEKHVVHLAYEYMFSVVDIHRIDIKDGLIIVNLHHWNGRPFTKDAARYASRIGIRLFNQEDFFAFAQEELISA